MDLHTALAALWCQWNGQRGTAKQTDKVKRQLTVADLARMLGHERHVNICASLGLSMDEYQAAYTVATAECGCGATREWVSHATWCPVARKG